MRSEEGPVLIATVLPAWVQLLAPKDADEAWVAQRWALLTRHVVALRLGLSPDERRHWDESWSNKRER
jgi:hypothetical protein